MFICFEGIDGAGKSTHINYFISQLQLALDIKYQCSANNKSKIISTREPGGTPTGEQLRVLLLHHKMDVNSEIMLAFSARNIHIKQVIVPALSNGSWVVSDRFIDSTYAYQVYGKYGDINLVQTLQKLICGDIIPNHTILFDIDTNIAHKRIHSRSLDINIKMDNFEQEAIDFHTRVRNGYLEIANMYASKDKYSIINADDSIDNIKYQLDEIIKKLVSANNS
jgi:dTMP kinase